MVLAGIAVTSLAPVVTALLALAITAERPSGPQTLGAGLAVLGTLVVAAAQAAPRYSRRLEPPRRDRR